MPDYFTLWECEDAKVEIGNFHAEGNALAWIELKLTDREGGVCNPVLGASELRSLIAELEKWCG